MAELGLAASAIGIVSLAIQVGENIVKLKEFYEAVREAPEEIKYLIEEIETLALVLREITATGGNDDGVAGSTSMQRCLDLGRKGTDILGSTVRDLEGLLGRRRRLGAIKIVLKRGLIDKLRDRLRSAQILLMLSIQAFSEALQKQRHEEQKRWAALHQQDLSAIRSIVSHSSDNPISASESMSVTTSGEDAMSSEKPEATMIDPSQKSKTRCRVLSRDHARVSQASKDRRRLIAQLRLPWWLFSSGTALEICGSHRSSSWTFTFQTYNIVPHNAPLMRLARNGDVPGIQKLFKERKASPFDRTIHRGYTALNFAAQNLHFEVCELLLNEGAYPSNFEAISPINLACMYGGSSGKHDKRPGAPLNVVRLLASRLSPQDIFDKNNQPWFQCDAEALKFLLRESYYSLDDWKIDDRVNLIFHLGRSGLLTNFASISRAILGEAGMNSLIAHMTNPVGQTLLHYAALSLGERFVTTQYPLVNVTNMDGHISMQSLAHADPEHLELIELIRDLLRAATDLHVVGKYSQTPFLSVMYGFMRASPVRCIFSEEYESVPLSYFQVAARLWLHQLKETGVDLVRFGREEKRVHHQCKVNTEWEFWEPETRKNRPFSKLRRITTQRLISFTYGPSPSDWIFFITEAMEWHFSEFWDMVDHPERAMPGAWIS